ncbi:LodA/GoxA family CTQ-dependent oxidase [Streptomyces prasinus]|uniref:LodA/GoxA family CTQ-dependent oxidase n=1 Tax=Streptomyces prasinus TaxID=67345 RepID=UPI0033BBDCF1
MNLDDVVRCEIHPSLGIARVGNSPTEFFIGPEVPGVPPQPAGGFKDAEGRVKRQVARFRVYGYGADGTVLGELTPEHAEISWTVELANTKGAWFKFVGCVRPVVPRRGGGLPARSRRAPDAAAVPLHAGESGGASRPDLQPAGAGRRGL